MRENKYTLYFYSQPHIGINAIISDLSDDNNFKLVLICANQPEFCMCIEFTLCRAHACICNVFFVGRSIKVFLLIKSSIGAL